MSIQSDPKNLYSPLYVKELFDEMSATYGLVNLITSFGFTTIWRKACVNQTQVKQDQSFHVVDLMSGMGEIFAVAKPHLKHISRITALDISTVMCKKIAETEKKFPSIKTTILEEDALQSSIPDNSADYVFCSFGLKTLNLDQQKTLAQEVARILKPGGQFSFVEISVPHSPLLRWPLFFYLTYFIPILGWLFLGNPDNYRHLALYTKQFKDAQNFHQYTLDAGLDSKFFSHFFHSATGVSGSKSI